MVMVAPGQLAMRREVAIELLEELIAALRRLEAIRQVVDPACRRRDPAALRTGPGRFRGTHTVTVTDQDAA